ncbi:hypothetical protein K435DRAFT_864283 [Dendrothele bispora CBS 962.96]|uniref:BTB domain-containing protein n=1 Tax=Dendrothele bispora (strain CBS 962.96) TaxID=1314807 RepID=A0A4S8LMI9_DENBC|nr:hypothetical protein K435DRAFT_864283 [Dendrothele bispora CBS 962.96]
MFYDTALPDHNAYVISVQNVLFRVNRELVWSFSPKLTTDLDTEMTANTSHGKKNDDVNPLVLEDSHPDEWQAMLWALSVDSSERMAHIETPDQLCRMISLAIIANRYQSVFEPDAMAAIYETCLPEHADLQSRVPSSILNRCTSFDFGYLMELCKRCLSLDDSDFSAYNPLIPRTVSNKGKSKHKVIAVNAWDSSTSSKYPPFYRNLPTMVLRHWIAELLPEARAWAIPLPLPKPKPQLSSEPNSHYPSSLQLVLPRASNVILPYTSMKDLHSPNTVLTVNSIITGDELDLHESSHGRDPHVKCHLERRLLSQRDDGDQLLAANRMQTKKKSVRSDLDRITSVPPIEPRFEDEFFFMYYGAIRAVTLVFAINERTNVKHGVYIDRDRMYECESF